MPTLLVKFKAVSATHVKLVSRNRCSDNLFSVSLFLAHLQRDIYLINSIPASQHNTTLHSELKPPAAKNNSSLPWLNTAVVSTFRPGIQYLIPYKDIKFNLVYFHKAKPKKIIPSQILTCRPSKHHIRCLVAELHLYDSFLAFFFLCELFPLTRAWLRGTEGEKRPLGLPTFLDRSKTAADIDAKLSVPSPASISRLPPKFQNNPLRNFWEMTF